MSISTGIEKLSQHFEDLTEPRVKRTRWHELSDMIVIAICATICGADSWEDLPAYGKAKLDWLRQFLPLTNGIPSADTFARVFQRLNPDEFVKCLVSWVESIRANSSADNNSISEELIGVDGQTLKGSDAAAFGGRGALHLVRAWASQHRMALGQQACAEKSNEIEAIPKLLKMLDLEGATVTIDALGCQKSIAKQIIEQHGDYVLALKENHPQLCASVRAAFDHEQAREAHGETPRYKKHVTHDTGHGRREERTYYHMPVPADLKGHKAWKGLRSLGLVIRRREIKGVEHYETQYYISSLKVGVKRLSRAIRSHWSIENNLHWMLDVVFSQDASRIRKAHGPEISSLLRQLALMFLQQDTQLSGSIRNKRKQAGWDNRRLEIILLQNSKH